MRPKSITMFDRLYLGSLALGLINYVFSYNWMMSELEADPSLAAFGGAGLVFILITAVISYALSLLLWFLIARKASPIAKWILVVLTAVGLISLPLSLMDMPIVPMIFTLVITGVQLGAIYFLFRPDARAWFENKGGSAIDPTMFE